MRIRTTVAAAAVLTIALAGCSSSDSDDAKPKIVPSATPSSEPSVDANAAMPAARIPAEPTGAKRALLLRALAAANPDIVKYEDKAIDAARNQCSSINNGGTKQDWAASQRFTYKDVTTNEAQGKQINQALTDLGFCKA